MRSFISVFLIVCSILLGCKQDNNLKNRYTLIATDNIKINIGNNSKNIAYTLQYFESDNTDFLALHNGMNNSIEFYNLKSEILVKELKIPREGSKALGRIESFLIVSFDSILVFSSDLSRLGLVDSSGNLYKVIPFQKDFLGNELPLLTATGGTKPIKINKKIYRPLIYRALEANGVLTDAGQKKSFIAISIDISSGQVLSLPLTYPVELIGKDVSTRRYHRVHGAADRFVYFFGNLHDFYVTSDHITFTRYPLETIYDLKFGESLNAFTDISLAINTMLQKDEIYNLHYDTYRNCYYVFIRKRENEISNDRSFQEKLTYPNCFILILDKNLKHLGEVHLPVGIYSFRMCFITKNGLYISEDHIDNPTFSEDFMRFRLFTLEKK
jgi:hypothetical protein